MSFNFQNNQVQAGGNINLNIYQVPRDHSSATLYQVEYVDNVPRPPKRMFERERECNELVTMFVSSPNAKACVLGPGGMGKTTLALAVLGDEQIKAAFKRRYFLSFEGLTTKDLVYTALARTLCLPPSMTGDQLSIHLNSQIIRRLREERALLCLDNFETFWDSPDTHQDAEELLELLEDIPTLSILVTLRGAQRPGDIDWTQPLLPPLSPLHLLSSEGLVRYISGDAIVEKDPEAVRCLIEALEGHPLAVTIVGRLLKDGVSPSLLWSRWGNEKTSILKRASPTRLSALDVSLNLSLKSPRMADNPNALHFLAALSLLPDGFALNERWIIDFEELMPGVYPEGCLTTLQNVSLCYVDTSTSPHRARLLSPVREFCRGNLSYANSQVLKALVELYTSRIVENGYNIDVDGSDTDSDMDIESLDEAGCGDSEASVQMIPNEALEQVETLNPTSKFNKEARTNDYDDDLWAESSTWQKSELVNVASLLEFALQHGYVTKYIGQAVGIYDSMLYLYNDKKSDLCMLYLAVKSLSEHPHQKAHCLVGLAECLEHNRKYNEASKAFTEAAELRRAMDDKPREMFALTCVARVQRRLKNYEQAQIALERILQINIKSLDEEAELTALRTSNQLAEIHTKRGQYHEALFYANQAIQSAQKLGANLEMATALITLGELYRVSSNIVAAIKAIEEASNISSGRSRGWSKAQYTLGLLYVDINRIPEAILCFEAAMLDAERAFTHPTDDELYIPAQTALNQARSVARGIHLTRV